MSPAQIVRLKKDLRCPSCQAKNKVKWLRERYDRWMSFQVNGREVDMENGYPREGYSFEVWAECECGKSWRVRQAVQITDIVELP